MNEDYLIWSHEHGAWWCPNRAGYCLAVADAGRYSRDEAIRICAHARDGLGDLSTPPNEMPVRVKDLLRCQVEFFRIHRSEGPAERRDNQRPTDPET